MSDKKLWYVESDINCGYVCADTDDEAIKTWVHETEESSEFIEEDGQINWDHDDTPHIEEVHPEGNPHMWEQAEKKQVDDDKKIIEMENIISVYLIAKRFNNTTLLGFEEM